MIDGGDVDPSRVQQARAEGETLRAVVVAADQQHRKAARGKLHKKIVEQCDGLVGGNALVVDVACEQNGVGPLRVGEFQNLPEDIRLIVQHGNFIDPLADVQVG